MLVSALLRRFCFPWGLICLIFVLNGCSMQKSGSTLDSAHTHKGVKPYQKVAGSEGNRDSIPVRVDYLTPLSAIKSPEFFVYKEKRRLYIVQDQVLVRDYPVGLGFCPNGDKEAEGDGRTPEGRFSICMKNSSSRFFKSLGLSYPDKKHAERAFFAGVITPAEFRDILLAFESKAIPPQNTVLGGKIFIHGGGAHRDWTDGCVALYNSDMEELFQIAAVGAPVSIRP